MNNQTGVSRIAGTCIVLTLLLAWKPAEAQVNFGVAGGLNFGSFDDVHFTNAQATYDGRSGYHIGVVADLTLGPLAVRPGLFYINAGPMFEGAEYLVEQNLEDEFNVNFITVPIDFRFRMPLPMVSPYFLVGPEFRFLLDSGADASFRENFRTSTTAANVGLGVQVSAPLIGISVSPEIRYAFDLTGLTEENLQVGPVLLQGGSTHRVNLLMLRVVVTF